MALKYSIDEAAFNALDEAQRSLYRKDDHDGTYQVDLELEEGYEVASFKGLKSALGKERDNAAALRREKQELEARLATAGDEALRAEVETLRRQNSEAEERHTRERAASEQRIAEAIASNEMKDAVTKHKGNQHTLIPVLKTMTKLEAGRVVVLDAAGKPRDGVTVEQLVGELAQRDEYAGAFAGTGQSGGGSSGGDTSKGASRSTLSLAGRKRSTMTVSEKAAYIKEHGSSKFMEIPW